MIREFKRILKGILLKPEVTDPTDNLEGSIWQNSADARLKTYIEADVREILTDSQAQVVTNKSIDGDDNTITNIGDDSLSPGINANKIADGSVSNTEFQYINSITSNVQDQLDSKASQASLDAHINDPTDAHDASAISYDNGASGLSATEVQGAIDELASSMPGAGANTTLSNLTSPVAFNQNLTPDTNGIRNLGSDSLNLNELHSRRLVIHEDTTTQALGIGSDITSPSGIVARSAMEAYSTQGLVEITSNRTGSTNSSPISLETGNTINGNSGNISLRPGVPSGSGTRGYIDLNGSLAKNGSTPIDPDDLTTKNYVDNLSTTIIVSQNGTPIVTDAVELNFVSGATINDAGSGVAEITVTGGGSSISGTPTFLAKFNGTGDNVEDSQITDDGTDITVASGRFILNTNEIYFNNAGTPDLLINVNDGNSPSFSTFVGFGTGFSITTGTQNTALGTNALQSNVVGQSNVAIGAKALQNNTASFNTAIGYESMLLGNTNAQQNVSVGYQSLSALTDGSLNTAIGTSSAISITTGENNTAIGNSSLAANTKGNFNTALGSSSLANYNGSSAISGYNVAIGYGAGANATGDSFQNIFIGAASGPTASGALSGQLYINPSSTASNTPLIYGDKSNNLVRLHNYLQLPEATAASTPASGYGVIYVKSSDGNLYYKDDAGTESQISGVGGGGTPGGSNTELQFNNSGVFGGTTNIQYDSTNTALSLNGLKLRNLVSTTLNDNTGSPTATITYASATFPFAYINYSIVRGSTRSQGTLRVQTDGSTVQSDQDSFDLSTSTGITFTTAVNGSNIEVRYTSTNTGSNATFKYSMQGWA